MKVLILFLLQLWQFNVYSKRWRKLDMGESVIIPDQLASHSIVMVNGKFILFGGTGAPFGLTTSNDVFTMDLAMRSWTVMDTLPEDEEMEIDPDEVSTVSRNLNLNFNNKEFYKLCAYLFTTTNSETTRTKLFL